MSHVSTTEVKRSAWADEDGQYRRRTFRVTMDDPADGPDTAITASGMPSIGDLFPSSSTIYCRSIGEPTTPHDSRIIFEFPVTYSDVSEGSSPTEDPDPLARPAEIEWGATAYRVAVEQDVETELPVVNSAGVPFDYPLEDDLYRPTVVIERNVSSYSATTADAVRDTVNQGTVTVAGAALSEGQGLIKEYSARAMYENGTSFIRERIVIEAAPTHVRMVLDRGYKAFTLNPVPESGEQLGLLAHIRDATGLPVTEPALLNGAGYALGALGTPVYLPFNTKLKASWASLNLPTTFPDT